MGKRVAVKMMLEVSDSMIALNFYGHLGYTIVQSFAKGEAGGGGEIVCAPGCGRDVVQTGKHVMRELDNHGIVDELDTRAAEQTCDRC